MSNALKDFITEGEESLVLLIKANSTFFSNITVLTNAAGDLNSKITAACAKVGLFLVVELKGGPVPGIGETKAWTVWITVTENPVTNRGSGANATGKTYRMAIEELMRLMDEKIGISEGVLENVPDPAGLEIWKIVGKVNVTLKIKEEE